MRTAGHGRIAEVMTCQCGFDASRGNGAQHLCAALALHMGGSGVQPAVSHHMLAAWRRMPKNAGDKFVRAQAQLLSLTITVIRIAKLNALVVHVERAITAQWAALDVAGQVQRNPTAMSVGLADLNVPVLAVLSLDALHPVFAILLGRQMQPLRTQRLLQMMQELAAIQGRQSLDGQ